MSFKKHGLFRHETTFLLAELKVALEIGIVYSHRICSETTFNNSYDLKSYMDGFEGTLRHFISIWDYICILCIQNPINIEWWKAQMTRKLAGLILIE